jgi:hypothetical protein
MRIVPTLALVTTAIAGAVVACGGSDSPSPFQTTPTATGTTPRPPAVSDAGDGGSDGDADTRDSGPTPSDGGPDAPKDGALLPFEPPDGVYQCPATATWVDTGTIDGISPVPARFSMSADELTAVWVVDNGTGGGTVRVADRADRALAFAAPTVLATADVTLALDQVAVSPDGLTLIAVSATRQTLVAYQRILRGEEFVKDTALVAQVNGGGNEDSEGGGPKPHQFRSPVLAYDGQTLVYADLASSGAGLGVFVAPLTTSSGFTFSGMFPDMVLRTDNGKHRLPTGMAPDRRTIFFFDEVSGTQKVAWRVNSGAPYAQVTDLGNRRFASPNANCKRLSHLNTPDGANGQPRYSVAP